MASSPTPTPFPPSMRDTVNDRLGDRQMLALDDSARYIVRSLIADAYALGFQDGRVDEKFAQRANEQANRDRAERDAKHG